MQQTKLKISPWAVVALALLCYCDSVGILAVMLPAIAVHELGHYTALRGFGCRLRTVNVGIFGLEMDYYGLLSNRQLCVCAAAGPVAGAMYALIALIPGSRFCRISGAVSAMLSAFNLLPILPLDGGRILTALLDPAKMKPFFKVMALLTFVGASVLTAAFGTWTLLLMAAWLLVCNFRG